MMQVLTANQFQSGAVVYWGQQGWQRHLVDAEIFTDQDQANQALAQHQDQVVGAYLIAVEHVNGMIKPCHIREMIRAQGPSHCETNTKGGSIHVPL